MYKRICSCKQTTAQIRNIFSYVNDKYWTTKYLKFHNLSLITDCAMTITMTCSKNMLIQSARKIESRQKTTIESHTSEDSTGQ